MNSEDTSRFFYFLDAVKAAPADLDRLLAVSLEEDGDLTTSADFKVAVQKAAKILKDNLPSVAGRRLLPEDFKGVRQALATIQEKDLPPPEQDAIRAMRHAIGA